MPCSSRSSSRQSGTVSSQRHLEDARLLARIESGELKSARMLELWRDFNGAWAEKQALELQMKRAGDEFGPKLDPDSEWSLVSNRWQSLHTALIAEAERIENEEEVGQLRESISEPGAPTPLERKIEALLAIAAHTAQRAQGSGPDHVQVEAIGGGSVVLSYVSYLTSGAPVPQEHEISPSGAHRNLYDRRAKRDWELGGRRRFTKVRRGYWTDEHGWIEAFTDDEHARLLDRLSDTRDA